MHRCWSESWVRLCLTLGHGFALVSLVFRGSLRFSLDHFQFLITAFLYLWLSKYHKNVIDRELAQESKADCLGCVSL